MVQDADGQNCRCRLICRLNISNESASATACGRAFQAGMVRGRNAYLNASTVGWKRWNCLGWLLAEFCGRGTRWYSCGTLTRPFVILYIMVSLLWSLHRLYCSSLSLASVFGVQLHQGIKFGHPLPLSILYQRLYRQLLLLCNLNIVHKFTSAHNSRAI